MAKNEKSDLDSCEDLAALWHTTLENRGDESFLKIPSLTRPAANSYPYAAFYKRASRIALVLREELSLQMGDRVVLLIEDFNELALLCHACWIAGLVVAPIDPEAPEKVFVKATMSFKPRVFVYSHSHAARVATSLSSPGQVEHWVMCGGSRDTPSQPGVSRLDDLVAGITGEEFEPQPLDPSSLALQVTKWTENGETRHLGYSQRGLVIAARVAARFYPPAVTDTEENAPAALSWNSMSPFSFEGILHACLVPFFSSIPHLWTDHESPGRFWDQLRADGVSFALIDQPTLRLITTRGKSRDWSPPKVDLQVYTDQRICYEAFEKFEERFGIPLSCQYLKAEAGGTIAGFTVSEVRARGSLWAQGYALPAVGYPAPELEFAIENSAGKRLPPESPGEVIVRSDYLMSSCEGAGEGYPRIDEKGRLHTGDEGFYLSGKGGEHFLFVTGCLRDFIVVGEERVNPALVECSLLSIRGVSEVAVVAFPNYHMGMELGAYVVPLGAAHLEEKTLLAALRRKVGESQCPKRIVIEKLRGHPFPTKEEILKKFQDDFEVKFRE